MGAGMANARIFGGGQIFILLDNNQLSYQTGQIVSGNIYINQIQAFQSSVLEIRLIGRETTFQHVIRRQNKHTRHDYYSGEQYVCNISWPISAQPQSVAMPGQWCYPFKIQLPDWLPNSMGIAIDENDAFADIQYYLLAQFIPMNKLDWMFDTDAIHSSYGFRQPIHIIKPPLNLLFTPEMATCTMTKDVGGFLGVMSTMFTARCTFEKNQYFCGELARFRVELDNSKCDKDVQSVKIKVCRKIKIQSKPGTNLYGTYTSWTHATYGRQNVCVQKYALPCKAKEMATLDCQVVIPTNDVGATVVHRNVGATPETLRLIGQFSPTVQGSLITVEYTLRCIVKHVAWNSFGEGHKIKFPIRINSQPVCWNYTPIQFQMPANWAPVQMPVFQPTMAQAQVYTQFTPQQSTDAHFRGVTFNPDAPVGLPVSQEQPQQQMMQQPQVQQQAVNQPMQQMIQEEQKVQVDQPVLIDPNQKTPYQQMQEQADQQLRESRAEIMSPFEEQEEEAQAKAKAKGDIDAVQGQVIQ